MKVKIKICGVNDEASAKASYKADFIGFVFYQKSPRFVTAIKAKRLSKFLKKNQKIVGLFVDADLNLVEHIVEYVGLDYIQFHGKETAAYIEKIKKKVKKPIIKAIPVNSLKDINYSKKIETICDIILFDTKQEKTSLSGGSGISFDWELLKNYNSKKDWILAGGLNIKNIKKALEKTNAPILDVSSGVEKELGVKCSNKIKKLIDYVKGI